MSEQRKTEGWFYATQNVNALCVRRVSINKWQKKKKNMLASLNGDISVIHVQMYIKWTTFLETRCILAMLSLYHDKRLVLKNLFITFKWDFHIISVLDGEMKWSSESIPFILRLSLATAEIKMQIWFLWHHKDPFSKLDAIAMSSCTQTKTYISCICPTHTLHIPVLVSLGKEHLCIESSNTIWTV